MNTQAAVPLAAGEFGFDRTDFAFIANTLYEDAGISLPASKANLVYSRLAKRLRALGLENFRDYCALVGSEDGRDERAPMIAALTTNVTRFFREPHHFDHLRAKVIEPIAPEIKQGQRLRRRDRGAFRHGKARRGEEILDPAGGIVQDDEHLLGFGIEGAEGEIFEKVLHGMILSCWRPGRAPDWWIQRAWL